MVNIEAQACLMVEGNPLSKGSPLESISTPLPTPALPVGDDSCRGGTCVTIHDAEESSGCRGMYYLSKNLSNGGRLHLVTGDGATRWSVERTRRNLQLLPGYGDERKFAGTHIFENRKRKKKTNPWRIYIKKKSLSTARSGWGFKCATTYKIILR